MRALCSQVVFSGFPRPDWRSWFLDISRNVQNRVLNFKPGKVVFQGFINKDILVIDNLLML